MDVEKTLRCAKALGIPDWLIRPPFHRMSLLGNDVQYAKAFKVLGWQVVEREQFGSKYIVVAPPGMSTEPQQGIPTQVSRFD